MNKKLIFFSLLSLVTVLSCSNEKIQNTTDTSSKYIVKEANLKSDPEGKKLVLFEDKVNKHKISAILLKPEKNSFNTKDITFKFHKARNGYCRVFVIKSEGPYVGERDYDEFCRPELYVTADSNFLAMFPIHIPKKNEAYFYEVYAPCESACEKPLKIEVTKTPGDMCKNGVKENNEIVYEKNTETTKFDYSECNSTQKDLEEFFPKEINSFLKNAEPRLQEVESEIDKLVADAEEKYPQFGKFSDTQK